MVIFDFFGELRLHFSKFFPFSAMGVTALAQV